jgi:hypothetical protein
MADYVVTEPASITDNPALARGVKMICFLPK